MGLNTDLALESYGGMLQNAGRIEGVHCTERVDSDADMKITEIDITNDAAAKRLGKAVGRYITLECSEPVYEYSPHFEARCRAVARELERVCPGKGLTLFIGLGNRKITPDSIGPLAADRVFATRHLKRLAKELDTSELSEAAAVAAGVMAQTGLESAELASAVCEKIRPAQVIVCDALACSEPSHMGRTIQLCSTGIAPGSGVENSREELSERTLGAPVAAVGVPSVSRIMSGDPRFEGLLVTPKPVDRLAQRASELIAAAVNLYLHPAFSPEEIASLI